MRKKFHLLVKVRYWIDTDIRYRKETTVLVIADRLQPVLYFGRREIIADTKYEFTWYRDSDSIQAIEIIDGV